MSERQDRSEHDVAATFEREDDAREAAEEARRAGVRSSRVAVGERRDERAELEAEMRDEVETMVAGPGSVGPFTEGMQRGMALWVPIGAILGSVAGLLIALPFGAGSTTLLIGAVVGAVAGAVAGFSIGPAIRSRLEGEGEKALAAERGVTVGIHTDDEREARRAEAALEHEDPERVDEVGREEIREQKSGRRP